ncbi:MAG: sugar phosphate isomerase/epimerase [Clostridia bacterium]|nr:sugar phosphate isomerase/epimerase [Clostridia bacterium]
MKIGFSGSLNKIELAKEIGYDYYETGVSSIAALSDEEFAEAEKKVSALGLPLLAGNGTFPKSVPLAGPEVDIGNTERYLHRALGRMAALGCKTVVLGSGRRREYTEEFGREKALRQLSLAATLMGEIAEENGMIAVMEPLCRKETNLINTVAEGGEFVESVACPGFMLLADYYHMTADDEGLEGLKKFGHLIRHAHIAEPGSREWIPADSEACAPFFAALSQIGYAGDLTLECLTPEPYAEKCAESLAALRNFAKKYGF